MKKSLLALLTVLLGGAVLGAAGAKTENAPAGKTLKPAVQKKGKTPVRSMLRFRSLHQQLPGRRYEG